LAFSFRAEEKEKKTKEKKNHREEKKCREGKELSFKLPFCPFTFGSRFCPPTFALLFQTLSLRIIFFSSKRKEKKKKKHKKKRNAEKGRSFLSNSCSTLSLLAPASTFPFLPFFPKGFHRETTYKNPKKKKKKKNHREEKKCRKWMELSFKLLLCPLTFGSHSYLPIVALLFQTLSFDIFLFSSKRKEKKTIEKKNMQRKEGAYLQALTLLLTFGSRFWPLVSTL
jgi:Na+/H+ antiporter NhaD/arsenite permease-like protein